MEIVDGFEKIKEAIRHYISDSNADIQINPPLPKTKSDYFPENYQITVNSRTVISSKKIDVSREEIEDSRTRIPSQTIAKIRTLQ